MSDTSPAGTAPRASARLRALSTASFAILALGLTSGVAAAQTAPAAPAAAPAPAANATVAEVVVTGSRIARRDYVAQSPIVTVTTQNLENTAQVGLEAQLNRLPQFTPSANTQFSGGNVQSSAQSGTPGQATLNLRGLGDNRNLVLLDGRRAQPSNARLAIDVNTIPQIAIDGVEVVSGGASAVYGSDALAGVVNFKLKKHYQGLMVDAQYGETFDGDGAETRIGVLWGGNFNEGKGNAVLALEYANRQEVMERDRSFYREGWVDGTPSTAGGSDAFTGFIRTAPVAPTFGAYSPVNPAVLPYLNLTQAQLLGAQAGGDIGVNPNGSLFYTINPLAHNYQGPHCANVNCSGADLGYKIATQGGNTVLEENPTNTPASLPLTRWSAYSHVDYQLTDHVQAYGQAMFTSYTTETDLGRGPPVEGLWETSVPMDASHPIPADLATLLGTRSDPACSTEPTGAASPCWAMHYNLGSIVGDETLKNTNTVWQVTAGLKGDLPIKDWSWEVYGQHGETDLITEFTNGLVNTYQLQSLLNEPNYGANSYLPDQAGRTSAMGNAGFCTSGVPLFSASGAPLYGQKASADCIQAITDYAKNTTNISQNVVEATLSGGLFDVPAGQVRMALGADYRDDSFRYSPDPSLSNTGSQFIAGQFGQAATQGTTTVKEFYAELLAPVVRDLPFVKAFDLDLGYRYSDYNLAGGVNSYKATADWRVNPWLSFRGGFQHATRAPNTAELFLGNSVSVEYLPAGEGMNPCGASNMASYGPNPTANPQNYLKAQALCQALVTQYLNPSLANTVAPGAGYSFDPQGRGSFPLALGVIQGNRDLKPENANTWTLGGVIRSPWDNPWLSRLSLSVDWYSIKITDAIATVSTDDVMRQCFNANGGSNPTYSASNAFCQALGWNQGDGLPTTIAEPYRNIGLLETKGIDFQLDWSKDLGPGALSLNVLVNYLDSYKTQVIASAPVVENAGTLGPVLGGMDTGAYRWKWNATLSYAMGPASLGLRWQHIGSARDSSYAEDPATTVPGVPAYNTFDLFGSWNITRKYQVRAGIDNLFDKQPLEVGGLPGNTLPAYYDVLGRRFFMGVTAKF